MPSINLPNTFGAIADQLADINVNATLINISIQLDRGDTAGVDAVASDLGGKAAPYEVGRGLWHYGTDINMDGGATVTVYCGDGEPVEHKRKRLAAELAALDAQIDGEVA